MIVNTEEKSTTMRRVLLCRLRSIATHRDHFVRRSVCPSVSPSVCHTRIALFRRRHMHSSECCHYFVYHLMLFQSICDTCQMRYMTFSNSFKKRINCVMLKKAEKPSPCLRKVLSTTVLSGFTGHLKLCVGCIKFITTCSMACKTLQYSIIWICVCDISICVCNIWICVCNISICVCNISICVCNISICVCNISICVCNISICVCNISICVCNISICVCNISICVCIISICMCNFSICVCNFFNMCVQHFDMCVQHFDMCVQLFRYVCATLSICVCNISICVCNFFDMCVQLFRYVCATFSICMERQINRNSNI